MSKRKTHICIHIMIILCCVWNGVVFKIRTFCVLMGMYNEVVLCLQYYSLYL